VKIKNKTFFGRVKVSFFLTIIVEKRDWNCFYNGFVLNRLKMIFAKKKRKAKKMIIPFVT